MFIAFTKVSDDTMRLVDITGINATVERFCEVLFPEYDFENDALYKSVKVRGYLTEYTRKVRVYTVRFCDIDFELQKKVLYDSEEETSRETLPSSSTFGTGYCPNMITNTFCGFGFGLKRDS